MLGLREFLHLRGLDLSAKVKILRHLDNRMDLLEIERKGHLERYQSYQTKTVFECEYIVSCVGTEYSQARFFGVYRVGKRMKASDKPLPSDFPYPEFAPTVGYFYELEEVAGFEDLKGRIIIKWGSSALAWAQWLNENADKGGRRDSASWARRRVP